MDDRKAQEWAKHVHHAQIQWLPMHSTQDMYNLWMLHLSFQMCSTKFVITHKKTKLEEW